MSGLTLDNFLRMGETKPYSEYVCGEAIQKPMPSRLHSILQKYFILMLSPFLDQSQLGEIFPEFRCIFGPPGRERAFVPDLVYIARDRLTTDRYFRGAPDLAIEILSPDQDMARFLGKIQFYLFYGVRLIWVIDPEHATITILAPNQDERVLTAGDMLDGGDVLPGFVASVDEIFAHTRI